MRGKKSSNGQNVLNTRRVSKNTLLSNDRSYRSLGLAIPFQKALVDKQNKLTIGREKESTMLFAYMGDHHESRSASIALNKDQLLKTSTQLAEWIEFPDRGHFPFEIVGFNKVLTFKYYGNNPAYQYRALMQIKNQYDTASYYLTTEQLLLLKTLLTD